MKVREKSRSTGITWETRDGRKVGKSGDYIDLGQLDVDAVVGGLVEARVHRIWEWRKLKIIENFRNNDSVFKTHEFRRGDAVGRRAWAWAWKGGHRGSRQAARVVHGGPAASENAVDLSWRDRCRRRNGTSVTEDRFGVLPVVVLLLNVLRNGTVEMETGELGGGFVVPVGHGQIREVLDENLHNHCITVDGCQHQWSLSVDIQNVQVSVVLNQKANHCDISSENSKVQSGSASVSKCSLDFRSILINLRSICDEHLGDFDIVLSGRRRQKHQSRHSKSVHYVDVLEDSLLVEKILDHAEVLVECSNVESSFAPVVGNRRISSFYKQSGDQTNSTSNNGKHEWGVSFNVTGIHIRSSIDAIRQLRWQKHLVFPIGVGCQKMENSSSALEVSLVNSVVGKRNCDRLGAGGFAMEWAAKKHNFLGVRKWENLHDVKGNAESLCWILLVDCKTQERVLSVGFPILSHAGVFSQLFDPLNRQLFRRFRQLVVRAKVRDPERMFVIFSLILLPLMLLLQETNEQNDDDEKEEGNDEDDENHGIVNSQRRRVLHGDQSLRYRNPKCVLALKWQNFRLFNQNICKLTWFWARWAPIKSTTLWELVKNPVPSWTAMTSK